MSAQSDLHKYSPGVLDLSNDHFQYKNGSESSYCSKSFIRWHRYNGAIHVHVQQWYRWYNSVIDGVVVYIHVSCRWYNSGIDGTIVL